MRAQEVATAPAFADLGLSEPVLRALDAVGYEVALADPGGDHSGCCRARDMLGQAQTGTGKTAAFALPLLSTLDLKRREPQVLVLVPTRELAIQVAEAFQKYAAHLHGLPRAADLRRPELHAAAQRAEARRAGRSSARRAA